MIIETHFYLKQETGYWQVFILIVQKLFRWIFQKVYNYAQMAVLYIVIECSNIFFIYQNCKELLQKKHTSIYEQHSLQRMQGYSYRIELFKQTIFLSMDLGKRYKTDFSTVQECSIVRIVNSKIIQNCYTYQNYWTLIQWFGQYCQLWKMCKISSWLVNICTFISLTRLVFLFVRHSCKI